MAKYTLDQLRTATLEQVKSDKDLGLAVAKIYSGNAIDPNKTLDYWTSGQRDFKQDLNFAINSTNPSQNSILARSVDRYVNWNNPNNKDDYSKALQEREKALQELSEIKKSYDSRGIDISSADWYKRYSEQLGSTPGGGQTSVQTAGITAQQVKDAGGISTKVDGTKTDLKTGNVTSADGKTITVNGTKYVNDPSNTALQKALASQGVSSSVGSVQTATVQNKVSADGKSITVDGKTYVNDPNNTALQNALAKQSGTPTTGAQSYDIKGVEDLYAKILSGELKPSKDNQAWTALYKDGKATPEQVEAYRRFSAMSDEATKLFEQIKAGTLKPSKTDPTWASMYKDGQATEAQKKAYAMWQEFTNKALSDTSNIKTAQDANNAINQWQAGQFMASEDSEEAGMVKDYGEMTSKDLLADLIGSTEEMPEAPSTMQQLTELRAEYGMDDMETEINNIKAEMEEIDAIKRERQFNQEGKRTSMGVIAGRVSEIERQENERLDALSRQLNAKVNAYESKLSVVNMMMSASQTDYQNAMSEYQTKFSQKMTLINAIKGYEDEEKATASANLQIAVESLQGQDYDKLSEVQRMTLESLATKAGMPSTLLSGLIKESFKNNILAQSSREGADGYSYMDFVMQDPNTGEISTKSIKLGALAQSQPTPSQLLDAEKSGYKWDSSNNTWIDENSLSGIFALPGGKYGPGVQCGEGYNILTGRSYPVGHSYEEKMQYVDKNLKTPTQGNGLVLPLTEDGVLNHGHIETVLDTSADYDFEKGTGEIYTVAYNRNGDGKQTFETWKVADLKKKYGNNWGFIPSSFTKEYQEKLGGIQEKAQANEDYFNGLVQDYLNGASKETVTSNIKTKFGDKADNYVTEFNEIVKQTRTDNVSMGNINSSIEQERTLKTIMNDVSNYDYIIKNLGSSYIAKDPVYAKETDTNPYEYDISFTKNPTETRARIGEIIQTKFGVKLTDIQLTQIYREMLSQYSNGVGGYSVSYKTLTT